MKSIRLQLLRKLEDIFKYLKDEGKETIYGIINKLSPLNNLNWANGDK